ncbi:MULTISPECIES: MmcQ/YjbR family DNA-binding protein [unclassified Acinetobacter]|uniref:MmcQ/YjbR family DNA-binding protein n=1 Tax=unclassified Acinetobacter TaxID=196816 RepID=UPI001C5519EF|nr:MULTISPECIES: MmcQ/YjbR family DNA-binding protein [unclassified Acinetobacter]
MIALHAVAAKTALALPETTCSQPFGEGCDVFKVMEKVFMLSFHLEGKAAINLKVLPDNGSMLRDIYPFIRAGWHMNKQHWISVFTDEELEEELLQDLVLNSYELVVSKLNKGQRQRIELLRSV